MFQTPKPLGIVFMSLLAASFILPIASSGADATLTITGPDSLTIYVDDPSTGFCARQVLSPVTLGPEYAENLGPNPQDPTGFIFRYTLKIPKLHETHALAAVRAVTEIIDADGNPVVGQLEPAGNHEAVAIDPLTVDDVPVVDFCVYVDDPGAIAIEYARAGPATDVFQAKVVTDPDEGIACDARLVAMQGEEGVVLTDIQRTGDIEKLGSDGFTITSAPGFHLGYIGINLRPNRDYLTPPYICHPDAAYVLSDVNFRHALFHLHNQEEIVASFRGYLAVPIQSLVPPAQGGWVNPAVPVHPYNPGNKTDTAEYDPATGVNDDACSILRYGGYLYDPGLNNWVTPYDIDGDGTPGTNHPDRPLVATDLDDDVPPIELFLPTIEVIPLDVMYGRTFIQDTNDCGLTSIYGWGSWPWFMDDVEIGDFDMYMYFIPGPAPGLMNVGRFPDHLETMCHSDHDVAMNPGDYNYPGCNDPALDDAVRTIITSLDYSEKLNAAHLAQNILYNESHPLAAFAYMPTYSRKHFNGFNPDLRGIVNSPGYGSDNRWTHLNLHWAEGLERRTPEDETVLAWLWDEEPELLNPCSASTVYAWDLIDKTLDGLIAVNPYTHEDMPWLAEDWTVDEWPDQGPVGESWMNVTFWLRKDVFWQDGNPFTAHDVAFSWQFLRDNAIPRYMSMWWALEDVVVIDRYTVRAVLRTVEPFLLYDLAATAALLPPQVWAWLDGQPLATILAYNPTANTTSTGPWFGTGPGFPTTQLFGTGPFVFTSYNPATLVADLHQSISYSVATAELADLLTEMFHAIGDVNRDGSIDVFDLARGGLAYGQFKDLPPNNPTYDVDADFNLDGVVDGRDLALVTWHWGEQREYPEP